MAKHVQILSMNPPHQLVFQGPFNKMVTCQLSLTNPTDKKIAFKVKTTAPKRYCVRPNSGIIEGGHINNVSIMLQPSDGTNEGDNEPSKHKFMVQSVPAGDHTLETIWKETPPNDMMEAKLQVKFIKGPNEDLDEHGTASHGTALPMAQQQHQVLNLSDSMGSTSPDMYSYIGSEPGSMSEREKKLELENFELKKLAASRHAVSHQTVAVDNWSALISPQALFVVLIAMFLGLLFGKLF